MDAITIRERATEAIKFWEPMRFVYNAVLAAIVLLYFRWGLPNSSEYISTNGVSVLILLAVLANVAYCAAYAVDLFAQLSGFREQWRTIRWAAIRHRAALRLHPHAILCDGNVQS